MCVASVRVHTDLTLALRVVRPVASSHRQSTCRLAPTPRPQSQGGSALVGFPRPIVSTSMHACTPLPFKHPRVRTMNLCPHPTGFPRKPTPRSPAFPSLDQRPPTPSLAQPCSPTTSQSPPSFWNPAPTPPPPPLRVPALCYTLCARPLPAARTTVSMRAISPPTLPPPPATPPTSRCAKRSCSFAMAPRPRLQTTGARLLWTLQSLAETNT